MSHLLSLLICRRLCGPHTSIHPPGSQVSGLQHLPDPQAELPRESWAGSFQLRDPRVSADMAFNSELEQGATSQEDIGYKE